jgi:hypothetical protein
MIGNANSLIPIIVCLYGTSGLVCNRYSDIRIFIAVKPAIIAVQPILMIYQILTLCFTIGKDLKSYATPEKRSVFDTCKVSKYSCDLLSNER